LPRQGHFYFEDEPSLLEWFRSNKNYPYSLIFLEASPFNDHRAKRGNLPIAVVRVFTKHIY
jgi:hypothetical protein